MLIHNKELLESGNLYSEFDKMVIPIIKRACESFLPLKIIPRIAGGWVRDHLMGLDNNDIDIVVEGTTCDEFGNKILSFDANYSIVHLSVNPQETESMPVVRIGIGNDVWFDITELGNGQTIQDDAKRRDFTINALYFNVYTEKVEDYVGGIEDLQNKKLRMPIDPTQSILEDPRRILRCFRFAARFNFEVDNELLNAISNHVENFEQNASKGRIGLEIVKMLNADNIEIAINLIAKTKMFDAIFDPIKSINFDVNAAVRRVENLRPAFHLKNRLVLLLAAIYMQIYDPTSTKMTLMGILKKLCLPNKTASTAKKWQKAAYSIDHGIEINRIEIGRMIIDLGEDWKYVRYLVENTEFFDQQIMEFVTKEKMEDIWKIKPLMNGNELCKCYGVKPDKNTRNLLEKMINWQILNPDKTKEDYSQYIKNNLL